MKVVNAFTTFAGLFVAGHVAGQPLDGCIASDDADANATRSHVIEAGGVSLMERTLVRLVHSIQA